MRNFSLSVGWVAILLSGCSLGSGSRFFGAAGPHSLTETAKGLRQPVSPATPRELNKHVLPPYTVEPGDVLLVQPTDLDSPVRLPGDQPVLPDGTINLGKYGTLVVAGKTVEEIAAMVRALVEAQVKGAGFIAVRVVTRVSKVYYVLGEVNAPGAYPLAGRETVLDGLLAAGGLNDRASRKNIILARPSLPDACRVVLPVCYTDIVQLGDTATNYQLAPGDRIYVPNKSCREDGLPFGKSKGSCCGGPQFPCPLSEPSCGNLLPRLFAPGPPETPNRLPLD